MAAEPQHAKREPPPPGVFVAVEIRPIPNLRQTVVQVMNEFIDECPIGTINKVEVLIPQNEDGGFITFYVQSPSPGTAQTSQGTAQTYLNRLNEKLLKNHLISGKDQVLRKP